jgi:hypothetical protein
MFMFAIRKVFFILKFFVLIFIFSQNIASNSRDIFAYAQNSLPNNKKSQADLMQASFEHNGIKHTVILKEDGTLVRLKGPTQ